MTHHLQIEVDAASPIPGLADLKITPIDIAIPEAAASALREAIAVGDLGDAIPGDGQIEEGFATRIPVRFSIFGLHINQSVPLEGEAILRVVEKP